MIKNIKEIGERNLKIHYIGTFFMSFVFLSPIMGLYYQLYSLTLNNIIFLSSIYFFFTFLLEIPTSSLGDNLGRVKTMHFALFTSLIPLIIYIFFPNYTMFIVAIFFAALSRALWSGNAQAKLEDDLKAIGKNHEFGKVIGNLISLTQIGKLLTPVFIFIILKYFPSPYTILASLDLFFSIVVFLFFLKLKEIDTDYIQKTKGIINSIKLHVSTIGEAGLYLLKSKKILILLFAMLFGTDLLFLAKIILPAISQVGVNDYIGSIVVWFASLAGIFGSLSASKIANKISWEKSFSLFVILNMLLHFLAFYFFEDKLILTGVFIFITFVEFAYMPIWNHILMDITPIRAKATIRSLFISILLLYQFILLFILSFIQIKFSLLIIGILMIFAIISSRFISLESKK